MEERIARLARASKGVVTWGELRALGISRHEISHRLATGYLIRVHRRVYRVGHCAPSYEASYLAAVKACGPEAVLFHRAAAYHQRLLPLQSDAPQPAVMCPMQRSVPGVRTKRVTRIDPLEVATYGGIPITTVPRTLVDLAATSPDKELARAVHEAQIKHGTRPEYVLAVLDRHPNSKGAAKLRRVLIGETPVTLSRVEDGFLRRLDEGGIARPSEVNRYAGSKRVDFRWPGRLTAEVDSYTFHNSLHSWQQDRVREREAHDRREAFRRYTWHDVFDDPEPMLEEIRELLGG